MAKKVEDKTILNEFPVLNTDLLLEHVSFAFGKEVLVTMIGRIKINILSTQPEQWPQVKVSYYTEYVELVELIQWFKEKFNYKVHQVEEVAKQMNKKGGKDE